MGIENVDSLKPAPEAAVRIPLVMWVNGERRVLGVAEITCPLNENERELFSKSELIAEAFDVPHDDDGNPIRPEGTLLDEFKINPLKPEFRKKP